MTANRYREWIRRIRFFHANGGWYFLSPDDVAVGPYVSEQQAGTEFARLAKLLRDLDDGGVREAVAELTRHPRESTIGRRVDE
jgi:hypothetical protein